MAGVQLSVCMVLIFLCKSSLAQSSDIQKELEIIKGQLQSVIVENKDLRKTTNELKHKVDLISKENFNLKMENKEMDHKVKLMAKDNVDLKRRTAVLERKLKYMSLSTYLTYEESEILRHNKISRDEAFSPIKGLIGAKRSHNVTSILPMTSNSNNNVIDRRQNVSKDHPNYGGSSIRKMKQAKGDVFQKEKRLLSPPTTAGPTVNGYLIAFSARVKSVITNIGKNQEIPFETVDTNIGLAFHPGTGTFLCPKDGVYAFFVTILALPNSRIQVSIVKDGIPVAYSYSHGDSSRYGSGSTSVIIRLQKGDRVWVREYYHIGTGNIIDPNDSNFMGFSLMLQ